MATKKDREELPKLSYVLLSHNREKYIRGAIESAFAQDYKGELEYIFSDDFSTDRTYEIIKECVAAYKGRRRVVVTQTPTNLHLAGNTNHAMEFATGEFVVRADDDDYSVVDRCTKIGKAIADNPGCSCVVTRQMSFSDADERVIRERAFRKTYGKEPPVLYDVINRAVEIKDFFGGEYSCKVWRIDVYRAFPHIPQDAYWVDDLICMYRANALGFCVSIPYITVMARKGCTNMSSGGVDGKCGFSAIMHLERFNDKYMNATYSPLDLTITQIKEYMRANRPEAYVAAERYFETLEADMQKRKLLQTYWRNGTLNRLRIRRKLKQKGFFSLIRCLPMPVFAFLLVICRKVKAILH